MTSIRVVLDHQIFASQVHGGISRYFANVAAALPACGVTTRIAAPLYVNAYLETLPATLVQGRRLLMHNRYTTAAARRVGSFLLPTLARRFDANIVHETYYAPRRYGPKGTPVALTVYDMIHEIYPDQWAGDPTADYKKRAVREADMIFCISESTRRDLVAFYPEVADRAVVTLLGFDPPAARVSNDMSPLVTSRSYLLYVGWRGGYKNFAALLEAYAGSSRLTTDFDLVCIGGGPFSTDEQQIIDAAELGGKVHQTQAGDSMLQRYYAAAALFVYPSLYEGFGLPPLEAMAAGSAVAVSNTSSIPEVCGEAAEYFDPADTGSIAAALERALYTSGRIDALRILGSERLKQFSWQRCAEETAKGYRSMVG